ncbi:hypothetical protein [Nocardioides ungokensis]|uniref:hypothetical protein n=1 Tax=Nocardioides ungokensis TaxID=1643322 RepID=UPI001FE8C114|nr:hypothetical protein [Nocardioides ungokensis]
MFGKLGRAATVLLVALPCLVSTGLQAAMPAAAEGAGPATDDATIAEADPLLDDPQRGAKAIRQLGDQLPVAAARNDLEPAQLRSLLRNDGTAWVDPQGSVFYVDPAPAGAAGSAASASAAPAAPLAQTFSLHSNPGANLTILLDFDGADVSGTGWNDSYGVTPGSQPAWDPAGDGAGFSDSEKLAVQQVWSSVAEDYAPFDVDVTTEDTGPQTLERASSADPVYGTRVLITPVTTPSRRSAPATAEGWPTSASSTASGPTASRPGCSRRRWATTRRTSPRPQPTRPGTTSASATTARRRSATTQATASGRRSWAWATTARSCSGAPARTPAPTTRRTTSPS